MKKTKKILAISIVVFLFITAGNVFADSLTLKNLQSAAESFTDEIAAGLPFNSTIGLNWSDAYIGQLLGIPPRFGVGISAGLTFLNISEMNNLLGMFGASGLPNIDMGLPLPAYTVEGRIGGIIFPFDLGFKVGVLPNFPLPGRLGLEYFLIGADLRYSLLPRRFPLRFSAGFGVNHLRGGLSKSIGGEQIFGFADDEYILTVPAPNVDIVWETTSFEFRLHASIPLFVITPYAGIGAMIANTRTGYSIRSDISATRDGDDVYINEIVDILNSYGLGNVTGTGFESMRRVNGVWNLRAYGGLSVNLTVFRFDLTVMYELLNQSLGATFGIRFQL